MKTRTIQQVGGGTYTVSIPVHWPEDHGILAGETAYLYTHRDGSLVVGWNEKERSELSSAEIDGEQFCFLCNCVSSLEFASMVT